MKIIARYIDDKYWFDVVVENSTTTEIHWRINDDRLLAGMIADIKPNSNGIDLKNKVIYLDKISCDITVAIDNYAQVKEIKNEILSLLPKINFTDIAKQTFKFKLI